MPVCSNYTKKYSSTIYKSLLHRAPTARFPNVFPNGVSAFPYMYMYMFFFSILPVSDLSQSGAVELNWTYMRENEGSIPGGSKTTFFLFPFFAVLFPSAYMHLERRSITAINRFITNYYITAREGLAVKFETVE